MPIDQGVTVPEGWLEADAGWIASIFGLKAVGEVRVIGHKIHIRVRHAMLKPEQVVVGQLAHAIIPQGFAPLVMGPAMRTDT